MIGITFLMTGWAALAGMTAHADSHDLEMLASGVRAAAESVARDAPASPEKPSDPYALALGVLENESGAGVHVRSEIQPPLVDCLHLEERGSVSSAQLADGKVSSFRIGAGGAETVTVSEDGGLWIGVTAVDSHVIEIAENGEIAAGTYTLIDYEGSIGGAGFKGLTLRGAPQLHAKLVNNTAETKIELVVSDADELEWTKTMIERGKSRVFSLWAPSEESETTGILGLLGFTPKDSTDDALQ